MTAVQTHIDEIVSHLLYSSVESDLESDAIHKVQREFRRISLM